MTVHIFFFIFFVILTKEQGTFCDQQNKTSIILEERSTKAENLNVVVS